MLGVVISLVAIVISLSAVTIQLLTIRKSLEKLAIAMGAKPDEE